MIKEVTLGIDTSNYTTSVALVSTDGELLYNGRRLLEVKAGERGLRQSEATFAHIKNLPELMEGMREALGGGRIVAVGVSERPRRVEGSYMPCFLAGVSSAVSVSSALGVPLYRFSHQCGHIRAALFSCGSDNPVGRNIGAFHISGGTTELLSVTPTEGGFSCERVGGTSDLNAGQVVDRIGVMLGLAFPAGGELDRLAREYCGKIPKRKPSVSGLEVSLSGLENLATRLFSDTQDKRQTAAFVFDYLSRAIAELSREYIKRYGERPMLYAGGVMRNSIIRERLASEFDAYFATPDTSSDNAVGIAALARDEYLLNK